MSTITPMYAGDAGTGRNYNADSYTYLSSLPLLGVVWTLYTDDAGDSFTSKLDLSAAELPHIYDNPYANGFLQIGFDASNNVLAAHSTGFTREIRRVRNSSAVDTGNEYVVVPTVAGDTFVLDSDGNIWGTPSPEQYPTKFTAFDWSGHTVTRDPAVTSPRAYRFLRNAGGIAGRIYYCTMDVSNVPTGISYVDTTTLAVTEILSSPFNQFQAAPPCVGTDGNIYVTYANDGIAKYDQDGNLLVSGPIIVGQLGDLSVWLYDANGKLWVRGDDPADDWLIIDSTTLEVESTVAVGGFTELIAEPFAGRPAFWGTFSGTTEGTIGVLDGGAAPTSFKGISSFPNWYLQGADTPVVPTPTTFSGASSFGPFWAYHRMGGTPGPTPTVLARPPERPIWFEDTERELREIIDLAMRVIDND